MTIVELDRDMHVAATMLQLFVRISFGEISRHLARHTMSQSAGLGNRRIEVDALQQGFGLFSMVSLFCVQIRSPTAHQTTIPDVRVMHLRIDALGTRVGGLVVKMIEPIRLATSSAATVEHA